MAIPALFQITQEHLTLLRLIEDNEGEITPDLDEALTLTKDQLETKAVSYAGIIKTFDADEAIIDGEIKRLQKLKERKAKGRDLFEGRLKEAMLLFGIPSIETPLVKIFFRKSESVEVTEYLMDEWKVEKVTLTPDKNRIKEAIKEGVNVPGATLVTKQNIQIR